MNRAFTLIEVIVAIIIFAVISTLIVSQVQSIHGLSEKLQARNELTQSAEIAITQLTHDLAQAYLSRYQRSPSFFVGRDQGEQDELIFTTGAFLPIGFNRRESNQAEVGYFVEDVDGVVTLKKFVSTVVDRTASIVPEKGQSVYTLLSGVERFNLEYFDGTQFRSQWNTLEGIDRQSALPVLVKITLGIQVGSPPQRTVELYETLVALPLSTFLTRRPTELKPPEPGQSTNPTGPTTNPNGQGNPTNPSPGGAGIPTPSQPPPQGQGAPQ